MFPSAVLFFADAHTDRASDACTNSGANDGSAIADAERNDDAATNFLPHTHGVADFHANANAGAHTREPWTRRRRPVWIDGDDRCGNLDLAHPLDLTVFLARACHPKSPLDRYDDITTITRT